MTKVNSRQSLPALDKSKSVQNPDLLNIADKNYTSTILKYSNLAILYAQLDTKDKHIVGAINEVNARTQPAKKVGETNVVGGVIIGSGLDITADGVLSATAQALQPATTDTLGGIIVGDYLNVTSDGTLSVDSSAVGKTYTGGKLISISNQNAINMNMTQSTPADIAADSAANPNVLFFTEGSPGGGGSSLYTSTVVLTSLDWDSNNEQTVSVSGITADSGILVSPVPSQLDIYGDNGVYAISQAEDSLTFKCNDIPDVDISVNVAYWEVTA